MKAMFFMLLFLGCLRASAQFQDLEQLKLNLEKLAQLKLMLTQAKQGYQTLQNGYNTVRDAARGNYDLHKNYLDGLMQVSGQVKTTPALKRFMDNSTLTQKEYRQWYSRVSSLNLFTPPELSAIEQTYQQINGILSDYLDQLQAILTPAKLRMSDGERVEAIEVLAGKSDEQLAALRQLIKEQTAIAAGRAQGKKDIEAIRRLYGLH